MNMDRLKREDLFVGRTHHDANHDLVVTGDLLPIRLRWSGSRKASR
jgi:hypothetical protein